MAKAYPRQVLPFPVKGLHKTVGFDIQPPGTTPDAINVRGYDALRSRLRGGRRSGLSKYLDEQINGSATIQAMAKAIGANPFTSADADGDSTVDFSDDFQSYTAAFPTYTGPNWTFISRDNTENGSRPLGSNRGWGTNSNGLVMDFQATAANICMLCGCRWRSKNNVIATMRAKPKTTTTNNSIGDVDECAYMGPFIRGNTALTTWMMAVLTRNASDSSVKLEIIHRDTDNARTSLVASSAIGLSGGTTVLDGLEISLEDDLDTGEMTARVVWPGAGTAGADIDTSVSVTSSTIATNRRSGVGVFTATAAGGASWGGGMTAGTRFRTFTNVEVVYFNTPLTPIVRTLNRLDSGSNRYFIPSGYTAVGYNNTGAGSQVSQAGPYDSNSLAANVPQIDTSTSRFVPLDDANRRAMFFRTTPDTARYDVEAAMMSGISSGSAQVNFGIRAGRASGNLIVVRAQFTEPTSDYVTTGQNTITAIVVEKWAANDLDSTYATFSRLIPVHKDSTFRVRDDGAVIKFYVDNNLVDDQQATTDYASQVDIGIGPVDDSGTDASAINYMRWRLQPDQVVGLNTSETKLVVVAGGSTYTIQNGEKRLAVGGVDSLTDDPFQVQLTAAYNRVFMVDGAHNKVYNLQDEVVENWIAEDGEVPLGCRLSCLYRGRLVLSGKADDPHNYFMSASGNAFNFNYSPTTPDGLQAVAGNNSQAGLIGDVITALIPFGDDCLIFGGDHTIYQMTGDPAAGGTVDLISDQTGIAFGKAWAKDPEGTLYFWGQNGCYRYRLNGGPPENMTRDRLNARFENLNRDNNRVIMEWDYFRHGLIIHIVNVLDSIANTSFFWDARTDAWWQDEYPAEYGPNCMLAYDGSSANDQAFIKGCRDGYLRTIDDSAEDDDGIAITSFIRFPIFLARDRASEVKLNEILPVMSDDSGPINIDVYTGQTAEECFRATNPRVRRVLHHAGRNASVRHKVRGYAVQLAISQTGGAAWTYESMTVGFEASGLPRQEARVDE